MNFSNGGRRENNIAGRNFTIEWIVVRPGRMIGFEKEIKLTNIPVKSLAIMPVPRMNLRLFPRQSDVIAFLQKCEARNFQLLGHR